MHRSSRPEVFLLKGVLKICSNFTGEHPCRSLISIKLQATFIEITLQYGCSPVNLLHIEIALRYECSPVNLLHIFRTPFSKNTSVWLLLNTLSCFFVFAFLFVYVKHWLYLPTWKQTSIIAKVHPVTVGHRYVDHQAKSFKIRIHRFTWCLALLRIASPLLKKTTNSEGLEHIFLIINWPLISLNDITIPMSWQLSVFRRYIKWEQGWRNRAKNCISQLIECMALHKNWPISAVNVARSKSFFVVIQSPDFIGTRKWYFTHYPCVVIVLFNALYVVLHFLQCLLEK